MRAYLALILAFISVTANAAFQCPEGQVLKGYIPNNAQLNTDNSIRKGECRKPSAQVVQPASCYTEGQVATPDGQGTIKWRSSILSQSTDNSGTLKLLVRRELQSCAPPGGCGPWTISEDQQDEWYNPVCGASDQCSELEGGHKYLAGKGHTGTMCNPNNNCAMTFTADDPVVGSYGGGQFNPAQRGTYTGQQCNAEPEAPESNNPDLEPDEDKPCGTVDGVKFCADEEAPNCGTIDVGAGPQSFCAGAGPDDGECVSTPGGQMVCIQPGVEPGEKPATPPAPNTGTKGDPAQPDHAVSNPRTGTTTHYYGSGTVGNSTHGDGDHDGDGECEAGEEDTPECEDEGGGECESEDEEECGDGGAKFTSPAIKYEYTGIRALIAEKKKEIADFITTARAELEQSIGMGDGIATGQGALSCPSVDIGWAQVELCFSDFEPYLNPVRLGILFAAAVLAFTIVLRK